MATYDPPFTDATAHTWDGIKTRLAITTRYIKVNEINGTSTDHLAYKDTEINAQIKTRLGKVCPGKNGV